MIDYYAFHNAVVADSIAYLCRAVKKQKPDCLAGAFYGYTAEIPNEDVGHHALHRLLTVPEIDFFASPHSYLDCRSPGIDWPFMVPVGSALLHGKLWFIENDVRTPVFVSFTDTDKKGGGLSGMRCRYDPAQPQTAACIFIPVRAISPMPGENFWASTR